MRFVGGLRSFYATRDSACLRRHTWAGMPTAVTLSGSELITTAFAPTETLFPIVIFPRIFAPVPA